MNNIHKICLKCYQRWECDHFKEKEPPMELCIFSGEGPMGAEFLKKIPGGQIIAIPEDIPIWFNRLKDYVSERRS